MIYRAKTAKDGKWVHGYYVRLEDAEKGRESHRIYSGYAESEPDTSDSYEFFADWNEVDPSTLGRSTGACDGSGEPIYEGDLIRIVWERGGGETVEQVGEVRWDDGSAGFKYFVKTGCGTVVGTLGGGVGEEVKIIGNVFDLPTDSVDTKGN